MELMQVAFCLAGMFFGLLDSLHLQLCGILGFASRAGWHSVWMKHG